MCHTVTRPEHYKTTVLGVWFKLTDSAHSIYQIVQNEWTNITANKFFILISGTGSEGKCICIGLKVNENYGSCICLKYQGSDRVRLFTKNEETWSQTTIVS